MSLHYSVTVTCSECKALIRFENQRPEWKIEDPLEWDAEAVALAHQFVIEHPTVAFFSIKPQYVMSDIFRGGATYVRVPSATRYIDCPSCDGRAYLGDANHTSSVDESESLTVE